MKRPLHTRMYAFLCFTCAAVAALINIGLYTQYQRLQHTHTAHIAYVTLALLQQELQHHTPHKWPQHLAALPTSEHFHAHLKNMSDFIFDNDINRQLISGQAVYLTDTHQYAQRLPRSQAVLTLTLAPPTPSWGQWLMYGLATTFALILPAAFALYTLQHHAQHLATVAQRLGTGQFSVRASLSTTSPLTALAASLNHMARHLHGLADTRKTLIDGISHDLRTPIARLRYRLEALRGTTHGHPLAEKILTQANHDLDSLNEMTEELLLFSRLDQPEIRMSLQTLDLYTWLNAWLDTLNWANQNRPQLINQLTSTDRYATFDPYYLGRALNNLITNAQRYGRGDIHITVTTLQHHTAIYVDDNGNGIPAEARQMVLRPFARLNTTPAHKNNGHGLGLAIVHKILEAHGGEIRIEDAPIGGARIVLLWPQQKNSQ